jgi:molybdenum cofactor biosynthesis enzyme MoaA
MRSQLRHMLGPRLRKNPAVWKGLIALDARIERVRTTAAEYLPSLVRPAPRQIEVAITAHCNLRCIGCRYGRDFMTGSQLSFSMMRDLVDDAKALGIWNIRFYGGEPLLHPDLPRMIEYAVSAGVQSYVTTNAIILKQKIEELYAAGLRSLTIGFYGTDAKYDTYVQRKDRYARMEAGIAAVRNRYGNEVNMRINWLLMRPSCSLEDLDMACRFAERYSMRIQVDLIHYSLPYFTEGPDRELQFRPEDEVAIEAVVEDLIRRKDANPELFSQSALGLRSIPDWLLKGPNMRVPCDSHEMLWVGADGTVQQCYVTFRLGNLHETRLRDMLHTPCHKQAAQDSYRLNCPNCHCRYDRRIEKHTPSTVKYREMLDATRQELNVQRCEFSARGVPSVSADLEVRTGSGADSS